MASSTHTARRAVLKGVLSAPLLGAAVPTLAAEKANTPLLTLYRDWDALMARWKVAPEEENELLADAATALTHRITAEPVTCLLDLLCKIVANTAYGAFPLDDLVVRDCERMLTEAIV